MTAPTEGFVAISAQEFAQGMALLAERWNREISPGLSRIYAETFRAADLSGPEFRAGVTRAIASREFFPSADAIIELARPEAPADLRAGAVFEHILKLRKSDPRFGMRLALDDIERECGAPARHAVVSIGGASRLTGLTDDALPFVLRDFAKAFAGFEAEDRARAAVQRALPEASRARIGGETTSTKSNVHRLPGRPVVAAEVVAAAMNDAKPSERAP